MEILWNVELITKMKIFIRKHAEAHEYTMYNILKKRGLMFIYLPNPKLELLKQEYDIKYDELKDKNIIKNYKGYLETLLKVLLISTK